MSDSLPRPSMLFATVSALVIAGNLLLLSAFIGAAVVEPNPFAIMGGLFVLPLCILLAVQQYRGTFRCVQSAATTTSVLLYVLGGFLIFGVVTSAGDAIASSISLQMMASILIPMLLVATCSIAIGRMNALWSRRIRSAIYAGALPTMKRGFSLRELLLAVSVIAAMTAITAQLIRSAPPWHAENIQASAAPFSLPPGATDVSYCKGHRGTIAYEFTTDESAFRDWVNSGIGSIESESAGIQLREIATPFTVARYFAYSSELNGPRDITVNSGLFYSWSKEDRGVHAVYDRTTSRAYYHAHFH